MQVTSCIETAFLFDCVAQQLNLPLKRAVCQVTAFSPKLAQAIANKMDTQSLITEPGYWAVDVGHLQEPGDYVGRAMPERNRYVGHVVCLLGDDLLLDVSADQMDRAAKGLVVDGPVLAQLDSQPVVWAENAHGTVFRYQLHPNVPAPNPRSSDRILTRLARRLAQEWRPR